MSETTLTTPPGEIRRSLGSGTGGLWGFRGNRLAFALLLLGLAFAPGELGSLTREMMADAFFAVSVFVAATLMLFYGAERLFRFDLGGALKRAGRFQVPMAALLGTTPGCGGAVVVVAAYASGNVRFGAVVATLTATMGDAAFLLIATRPDAALVVLPLSFCVGIISGWVVDHFNRGKATPSPDGATGVLAPRVGKTVARHWAYLALAAPGLGIGIADLAQVDMAALTGIPLDWYAVAATAIGLVIWARSPLKSMTNPSDPPGTRVAEETAFISVWVISAFLIYEYAVAFGGLDLGAWFAAAAPILPLIGVLIGFVPGCGPQILVTSLYISGVVPFAALIGNAISNDGDALFPALAVDARAALWATLYSGVPALLVAYGFYLLAPGFMD